MRRAARSARSRVPMQRSRHPSVTGCPSPGVRGARQLGPGYDRGATVAEMAVTKISISLDAETAQAARRLAAEEGVSLSAWIGDAAASAARIADGLAAVREFEAEHGALTDDERAAARAEADRYGIGRPA